MTLLTSLAFANVTQATPMASYTMTNSGGGPRGECVVPCTINATSTSTDPSGQPITEEWSCDDNTENQFQPQFSGHTATCRYDTTGHSRFDHGFYLALRVTGADGTKAYHIERVYPFTRADLPGTVEWINPSRTVSLPSVQEFVADKSTLQVGWSSNRGTSLQGGLKQLSHRLGSDGRWHFRMLWEAAPRGAVELRAQATEPGADQLDDMTFRATVTASRDKPVDKFRGRIGLVRQKGQYAVQSTISLVHTVPVRIRHTITLQKRVGGTWRTLRTAAGQVMTAERDYGDGIPVTARLNLRRLRTQLGRLQHQGVRLRLVVIREVRSTSGKILNPHSFPVQVIRKFPLG